MAHGSAPTYRRDIDGLRAIAVLPVVIYHAFPHSLNGGFLGVDVFFVISGYLITSIIWAELGRDDFRITRFYARRIRRIFPALFCVLAATGAFGAVFLFANEFANLGKHMLAGTLFYSNFALWAEVGYFDASAWSKPLLHLWSLAVEEQFYIFWPLVLICLMRLGRGHALIITVLFLASFTLYQVLGLTNGTAAFYLSLARFWELLAGGALAIFAQRGGAATRLKSTASIIALLLLAAGFAAADEHDPSLYWVTAIVTASATALIWAGPDAWANRHILSPRPMVWIGLISYPLYLWHWPILSFLRIGGGGSIELPTDQALFAIAASILLAWGTFALIERRIRFRKSAAIVPALAGAMAGIGVLGLMIQTTGGLPGRMQINPPGAQTMLDPYPHPQNDGSCAARFPDHAEDWACMLSRDAAPAIILVGDSHANQYYRAFAEAVGDDRAVLNIGVPTCLPFNGFGQPRCLADQQRMLDTLTALPQPVDVILTGYFSVFSAAGFVDEAVEGQRVAQPLSDAAVAQFLDNGAWVLSTLLEADHRVHVIRDIPDLVERPINCLTVDARLISRLRTTAPDRLIRTGDNCTLDRARYEARIAPYDDALDTLLGRFPDVAVLDPRPTLCDADHCYAIRDGQALYWNSDHLSLAGARAVVDAIWPAPR